MRVIFFIFIAALAILTVMAGESIMLELQKPHTINYLGDL